MSERTGVTVLDVSHMKSQVNNVSWTSNGNEVMEILSHAYVADHFISSEAVNIKNAISAQK